MKILYVLFLVTFSLFGATCADQYNNQNYATATDNFSDIVGDNFQKYFEKNIKNFKGFQKKVIQGKVYYLKKGTYVKHMDSYYPLKNGVWKLHADKYGKIDELDLAKDTLYQDPTEDIANDLNSDMGNLWVRWDGDAYEHYMVPEYIQINYKNFYISLKAFIYGSEGDSTGLRKAMIDFYIINNTKEVNKYIKCKKH